MKTVSVLAALILLAAVPANAIEAKQPPDRTAALQAQIDVLKQQIAALQRQVNSLPEQRRVCIALECA